MERTDLVTDDHRRRLDLAELQRRVGAQPDFFSKLQREDDWSFVVKSHSLLEASVTYLLKRYIGHDALEPFLARLDMSARPIGKLELCKHLGLLDDDERRFIHRLSELRNRLLHDVSNVAFVFSDEEGQLIAAIAKFVGTEIPKSSPIKLLTIMCVALILAKIYYSDMHLEIDAEISELDRKIAEEDAKAAHFLRNLFKFTGSGKINFEDLKRVFNVQEPSNTVDQ